MTRPLSLVTLSGSLRERSFNSALLRALPEFFPDHVTLTRLEWRGLPVLDVDDEQAHGLPAQVRELQQQIRAADGLIIATPEYNHGVPGGLKNALDWLSRGPMPHGLYGVPTAILGASNGPIGTFRAQAMLRQTLAALNAPTLPQPQVLVGNAQDRFDDSLTLVDAATRKFIAGWAEAVVTWMERFRAPA
ncbi:MAG: NAD(P)H-dependent oxidoreductase [Gemmatimonadetes bacterium]|nr:NAD(P)H-dependent oxidoreductase [Gemmatimonadota bacterium]MCB9505750.1 NAD(P)H-dependent oxidoreductase [Gemmatimonadales bacterium]MCB9519155.1 NAD(P)H-dependent oxidoreductase [Gemmatimonadales bacterium]